MSEKAIKFMDGITLDAMAEQDVRHPNRAGARNQQELDMIIHELLRGYPAKFLKRIGVIAEA